MSRIGSNGTRAPVALTPETDGILNYETFSKLRRDRLKGGPVIINAARGGHQREADIVRALTDGTLGAASLDVFEVEPLPLDSPLRTLPNVILGSHNGSNTAEASARTSRTAVDNLLRELGRA